MLANIFGLGPIKILLLLFVNFPIDLCTWLISTSLIWNINVDFQCVSMGHYINVTLTNTWLTYYRRYFLTEMNLSSQIAYQTSSLIRYCSKKSILKKEINDRKYWSLSLRFRNKVWFMELNATFNNISAISWRSVLLMVETGVPGENHRPVAIHWQTLSHNVVLSTPR